MSEKTEDATDHKLNEARKKGQVAHSGELASSFGFAAALVTLALTAALAVDHLRLMMAVLPLPYDPDPAVAMREAVERAWDVAVHGLIICVPVVGAALLGTLIGGFAQVGFNVSMEPLTPKLEKIDPVSGVKRIFSLRSIVELVKTLVKAVIIGWILYVLVRDFTPLLAGAVYGQPMAIAHEAWTAVMKLGWVCAPLFLVLGVTDYVVQRLMFLKEQKMSKDEVKREYKQMEGDPLIKGERRAIAQEIAMSDPKPAVAGASAVVVNPTHYAVALRYDGDTDGPALPVVVAKGVDGEALRIRELAAEFGVPVIGSPVLARTLYLLPVGSPVPEAEFEAVAIVLRWAMQVREAQQPAAT